MFIEYALRALGWVLHFLKNKNIKDMYNTLDESHQNERDLEIVYIWDCTIEDVLEELIGATYTDKIYLFFGSSSLKSFIVKPA